MWWVLFWGWGAGQQRAVGLIGGVEVPRLGLFVGSSGWAGPGLVSRREGMAYEWQCLGIPFRFRVPGGHGP